jgi:hypothetical protein
MIVFIIIFGMMYTLAPMVLGAFFSALPTLNLKADWEATNLQEQATIKFLIQLVPSMGVAIIIFKSLMVATVRGRD